MGIKKLILTIILLLIIILTIGYILTYQTSSPKGENNTIGVIVTVPPQAEFAKAVGGDRVKVTIMVPPGADPHTYEPLPQQMQQISQAQVYLAVGTPLEFELTYLNRIKEMNPSMKVFNTSQGINYSTELDEEGLDPHVWVSPKNARIMVNNTYQAFVEVDPQNQAYYQENRDRYLNKLDILDNNITNKLKSVNNKKLLVYHPAWGYFARDYGLEQIPIQLEGKEPTSQQIAQIVEQAKKENINIIFVSPQFNQKSAEVISSEINGKVVAIDPLAENYLENMEKVLDAIQNSLR